MAWFCSLRKLDLDHLLAAEQLSRRTFLIKLTVLSPCAEVASSNLPNQVSTVFKMVRRESTFASVVSETTIFGPAVQTLALHSCSNFRRTSPNIQNTRGIWSLAVTSTHSESQTCGIDMMRSK